MLCTYKSDAMWIPFLSVSVHVSHNTGKFVLLELPIGCEVLF